MWMSFLKAVRNGEHRLAPMTWIAGAGAVLYTLWPLDLIPELVLGPLGLVDDAGLWGILIVLVTREKQRYEAGLRAEAIDVEGTVR
ncbi:DUF1232 domain-containing protein [Demequina sp. SYSU T00192]|uniref:DUF1232 domain-containing protein n=1 Tax=Demequina litoralis TaxID=3051660 RepID=A0ABT8GBA8_9MICO|nr:DUF1232 domain-containing protein [Demequina sp. SYSU T00192]MDN4476430.1 DUF1232 domain-containing protein [Demequina sp. SYSU T00192]